MLIIGKKNVYDNIEDYKRGELKNKPRRDDGDCTESEQEEYD